ncbi:MAG: hypothetical protein IPK58_24100 [Acidobacteria bacterium]|nr:hypothetical protein [Acidobacteriota bacterium]
MDRQSRTVRGGRSAIRQFERNGRRFVAPDARLSKTTARSKTVCGERSDTGGERDGRGQFAADARYVNPERLGREFKPFNAGYVNSNGRVDDGLRRTIGYAEGIKAEHAALFFFFFGNK